MNFDCYQEQFKAVMNNALRMNHFEYCTDTDEAWHVTSLEREKCGIVMTYRVSECWYQSA